MTSEKFDQFIVYKSDLANSFLYANCSDADSFMDGLADYILSESNLLNYANTLTPIAFVPTPKIYKRLYSTISSFLNSALELLTFDDVTDEVRDVLGKEYTFVDCNGKTLVQKDKIGKIGEYTFHVLLSSYYDEYKTQIARKHRFSTVQFLLGNYFQNKSELVDVLYRQTVDPNQSKIRLVRILCKILGMGTYDFKLKTFIINRLTYKYRQTVREVVDATKQSYPATNISKIINTVIRYKSSYIEFDFYSKVDLIRYFMECDKVSISLIHTLHERLLKNIEMLYYLNSPSKKLLKDMGIYEGDIDQIIRVIGSDFSSVSDLEALLARNYYKLSEISVVSRYIIARLINSN